MSDRTEQVVMAVTRKILAENPRAMLAAIAAFPLQVVTMAAQLNRLIEGERYAEWDNDTEQAAAYLERIIRDCYRKLFGAEIGEHRATEPTVPRCDCGEPAIDGSAFCWAHHPDRYQWRS